MGVREEESRISLRLTPSSLRVLDVCCAYLIIYLIGWKFWEKGSNLACSLLYSHINECIEHNNTVLNYYLLSHYYGSGTIYNPFNHQNDFVRNALLLFPFNKWRDRLGEIKWLIPVNRRVEFKSILSKWINSLKLSKDLGLPKYSDYIWNGRWRKVHRFITIPVWAIEKWC